MDRVPWYREVQFVSAVPMPQELADEFGTTVNGMWAAPELRSAEDVEQAHRKGQRVLFSVPMIALTPSVYEAPEHAPLLQEVCADVEGDPAHVGWYYWEPKPVYSVCIYSEPFRRYLLDRCLEGIERGMDVVNLDEINTSIGLMTREARGSGFCARCLERFRAHLRPGDPDAGLASAGDDALRAAIGADDALYDRYRAFHEVEAFRVVVDLIEELRAHAAARSPDFAVTANLAYLGNDVPSHGALWGPMWGEHVDFVMMENRYRIAREGDAGHLLLPRGTFGPWYRLGAAFKGAPDWICPSIMVPRQLAGQKRTTYYLLMFLEAYANNGRWGYYWWPGVDVAARLEATAPETLKDHIRFIGEHRELYERAVSMNELAVLYADGSISRRPETHERYLALAQALAEAGYQFDVLYAGDGRFNPDELDPATLGRYRAILVPEARDLGPAPAGALEAFARAGGELLVFSDSPLAPDLALRGDGDTLDQLWRGYRDEDRERVLSSVSGLSRAGAARIVASDPGVRVTSFDLDGRRVLHLLNVGYDEAGDSAPPVTGLRLRVPWTREDASCTLLDLEGESRLESGVRDGVLSVEVPRLDPYAVLVAAPRG
jgi:hypothetical protein